MSTGGLQRRRVGGGGTGTGGAGGNGGGDEEPTAHAGSAFASPPSSGPRVAYDPRDLLSTEDESRRIGGTPPKFTLMEQVILLGINDKQGYLSFWNDNLSYVLRGLILVELAMRKRIALSNDPHRKRLPLGERIVEVIDTRPTGETVLDEALKVMRGQVPQATLSGAVGWGGSSWTPGQQSSPARQPAEPEKLGVNAWIDLLSGETWSLTRLTYQLRAVRERLLKGLVDKGVLRTEKRNFLLFDMATHPLADYSIKNKIIDQVIALLTSTTSAVPSSALGGPPSEGTNSRVLRSVVLVLGAYCASVLDNAFGRLGYEDRENAFGRADELLGEFSVFPFGSTSSSSSASSSSSSERRRRHQRTQIATGSTSDPGRESVRGLVHAVQKEQADAEGGDLGMELIAGVMEVLGKLDSLL